MQLITFIHTKNMKRVILFLLFISLFSSQYVLCQIGPLIKPDQIPVFKHEGKGQNAFIIENLIYPEEALKKGIEGTSFIGYTIGFDGVLRDAYVWKSAHPLLDEEALRVVRMMKQWQPAMKDGLPMEFKKVTPIKFSRQNYLARKKAEEIDYIKTNTVEEAEVKEEVKDEPQKKVQKEATVTVAPEQVRDRGAVFTYKGKNMQTFIYENLEYPEEALFNGIEGTSYIGITIGADGKMRDANIWKTTNPILDKAALKVVKKMKKWEPAIKDGQPIETKRVIPVTFSLKNVRYKVVKRYIYR